MRTPGRGLHPTLAMRVLPRGRCGSGFLTASTRIPDKTSETSYRTMREAYLVVSDTVLLVGGAERNGGNDGSRLWIWLRTDVNRPGPETVVRALLITV